VSAPTLADLRHARVALLGYGREGAANHRALRRRAPTLSIDIYPNTDVAAPEAVVTDRAAHWMVGTATTEQLDRYDWIVKSPGISPYREPLTDLRHARLTSGSALWFAEPRAARVIAITGTKGKSTTSSLTAHLLAQLGHQVALAGNIGTPLLDLLDQPREPDFVVAELSSYQTADFSGAPELAACLNLYPEHLDWHLTEARYYADKLKIFARAGVCLINAEHDELRRLSAALHPQSFSESELPPLPDSPLLGAHNLSNIAAALKLIALSGNDRDHALKGLRTFQPLPHRLTVLGIRTGVRYIDDSIATTPHATLAAINCFERAQLLVLIGGFDRGVSWDAFAKAISGAPPKALLVSGANRTRIADALAEHGVAYTLCDSLAQAVARAQTQLAPGDTLLLSPGAPSFDAFIDYAQRGNHFAQLLGFEVTDG
jgi:UDP-N-acetylmuramoyl-L-alanine---L-glutamate ligase